MHTIFEPEKLNRIDDMLNGRGEAETPKPSIVKRRKGIFMKSSLKFLSVLIMFSLILSLFTACKSKENKVVRLSTTTSVQDSGLLEKLEEQFEKQSGYELEVVANGTGAAIKMGETGDADVLLVHAKAAEEEFVNAGFGIKRLPFMHNFFIIAGDPADPAKVADADTAAEAFARIEQTQSTFVSRGDDSGTHKAELKIWQSQEIEPSGDWYVAAGKGMGPCLVMAGEMQAYVFSDKATWIATRDQHKLDMLMGSSDDLKNTYSVIAVNPDKHPETNAKGAQAWIDYLKSNDAKAIIDDFGMEEYNEALFIYDGFEA